MLLVCLTSYMWCYSYWQIKLRNQLNLLFPCVFHRSPFLSADSASSEVLLLWASLERSPGCFCLSGSNSRQLLKTLYKQFFKCYLLAGELLQPLQKQVLLQWGRWGRECNSPGGIPSPTIAQGESCSGISPFWKKNQNQTTNMVHMEIPLLLTFQPVCF